VLGQVIFDMANDPRLTPEELESLNEDIDGIMAVRAKIDEAIGNEQADQG